LHRDRTRLGLRTNGMAGDSLAPQELRAQTLAGLRWVVIARPLAEVILILSMVVLARLVSPGEFGRYAVAAIAGSIAIIPIAGVGAAVVQRPSLTREHLQGAFALSLAIGVGLAALTIVAATLVVAPVYGVRTAEFVRWASPLCIVVAAGAVPSALLRRRLAIRRSSVIELASTAARAAISIGLALAGLRGLSLVLGWLAGEVLEMALVWASAPPPLPIWRRGPIRELLSFGAPASLAAASWFGFRNCDYAIIGARLGPVPTGLYFRAYTLGVEYQKKVSNVMSTVGFPALARTRDREEMEALRGRMARMLTIILFPLLVLLAVEAPVVVPWLFGARWSPAVVPTQILAVGGASTLVIDSAGAALMAAGRSRALMAFGWGHFVVYAIAVFFVSPKGIVAVAIAAACVHSAFLFVSYALVVRGTGANPVATLWRDIKPAIVSSIAPAGAALPVSEGLRSAHVPAPLYVTVTSLAGALAYLLVLRVCFPASMRSLRGFVGHLTPRRRPLPATARLAAAEGHPAA
jgi:lipopolysaccharide exporter